MSDMSRPRPAPPLADHERHDPLLVAQLVAGDPLKPEQEAEARRLVAGCSACAALAADLPAISRAVAQEPVPRRRRDHRLSPEQAEHLRGNPVTRFLRRLSLPSSRAFQPAAAGVLSIGLLFVVAGYAWPDGGTVTVQAEPNFIDWSSAVPSAAPMDDVPEGAAAPLVTEPDAFSDADAADALDGAARLMEDPEFADALAESQAGLSEGLAQKSQAGPDAAELEAAEPEAAELPRVEADGLGAAADAIESAADEGAADAIEPPADDGAAERAARAPAPNAVALGEGAVEETATLASAAPEAEDDPAALLIVLGLVLALGGSGLLLLGWLARRARDPLAP